MTNDISNELAEICGIHAGDGYLRNDGHRRELDISGNIEEKEYYDNYMIPLFSKQFGIKIEGRFFKGRNTYGFVIRDKTIIEFMHELGFPYGAKSAIVTIPTQILYNENKDILKCFLRGYFDTDGNINFSKKYGTCSEFKRMKHWYPRIQLSTVSKQLFEELWNSLLKLGFRPMKFIYEPPKNTENTRYCIHLNGVKEINKWFVEIGSGNPVKYTRYFIWKKHGFCPPRMTLEERQKILNTGVEPILVKGV